MKSKIDNWKFPEDNVTGEYWWVCISVGGAVRGNSQKKFNNREDCIQDARKYGYPRNYKAPTNSEEFWNE